MYIFPFNNPNSFYHLIFSPINNIDTTHLKELNMPWGIILSAIITVVTIAAEEIAKKK